MKKTKIRVAETAGFCFGVNRAVETVENLLSQGKKVYTLGPIIHNPQVVEDFNRRGATICNDLDALEPEENSVLVIRSHGVAKSVYEKLIEMGIEFVDATCPFVEKIHKIVESASNEGKTVLIAGDEHHPEVMGIMGFSGSNTFVFSSPEQLEKILNDNHNFTDKEIVVVSQTTFDRFLWEKSEKILKKLCTNAKIFDTICVATSKRQNEAEEMSRLCDLMIVIGGRQSSNTAKISNICSRRCKTCLIESADELNPNDFADVGFVGVTAGASTPAGIIKEVQTAMSEIIDNIEKENEAVEAEVSKTVEQDAPVTETESEVVQDATVASEESVAATDDAAAAEPVKSFEDMTDEEALEYSLNQMNNDQHVKGCVLAITPTEIQVDINRKQAGYIPMSEYSSDPTVDPAKEVKIGDVLDLIVMRTNDQEGTVMLSKKRYDATHIWDDFCNAINDNTVFEGKIIKVIKGGVLANANGIQVFIPASQTGIARDGNLEELINTVANFKILEVNRGRRRAVGSIRAILRERRREEQAAFWNAIEEGKVYTGKVKSLTTYGAFVDLGGVDGMVHISELSWKRIKHPSEIVKEGDVIEVFVKSFDPEKRKISLGFKKPEDNPWNIFLRDYKVDDVVPVKVVSLTSYGAFANILEGIDGLIHISQIANERIAKPQDVLKVGDTVEVKITEIDTDRKRISLSRKALLEPVEEPAEETVVEDASAEETPVVEAPAEETSAVEAPVEEAPAVEAPVEEAPVEEAPEEEIPVEEVAEEPAE